MFLPPASVQDVCPTVWALLAIMQPSWANSPTKLPSPAPDTLTACQKVSMIVSIKELWNDLCVEAGFTA